MKKGRRVGEEKGRGRTEGKKERKGEKEVERRKRERRKRKVRTKESDNERGLRGGGDLRGGAWDMGGGPMTTQLYITTTSFLVAFSNCVWNCGGPRRARARSLHSNDQQFLRTPRYKDGFREHRTED